MTDKVPLLRTFRAELAKRSSMLVDEDMQEYFQQLADYEGYGGLQAMGRTGQMFGSQTSINLTKPTETVRSVTVTSSSPVKWRMKTTPVSSERLSSKVASMSSLTGADDLQDFSSQSAQTLITVRQGCLSPKGTCLNVVSILNAKTGRKVNLADAIKLGVFDTKTGMIVDSRINKKMNITQAVGNRYVSHDLMRQLTATCGICDEFTGNECTMLEAIQKDLFNPCNNTVKDPSSGKYISLHEGVARGLLSQVDMDNIIGEGVTVTFITQSQAMFTERDLTATTLRLGLGDMIESGLYNSQTGKVYNPLTGNDISVIEAVEVGLINPAKKEIKGESGEMLTLSEAVNSGIVDPDNGLYLNKSGAQKVKLDDAYQRKWISKPSVLPAALHEGAILDNGRILDTQTGRSVTFKEAIDTGVIDSDLKTIVDSKTGDVLSVTEAIEKGLLDLRGSVKSNKTMSLSEAVDTGVIKLVKEDLAFSKPCVQDTKSGKMVSVPEAMKQGIITSNGDFVDTSSGRRILLKAASSQGFITRDMSDLLQKDISFKDSGGRNISVLKAIQIGLIVPDKAEICDPQSRRSMSLQQAAREGIVATEDALVVLELLSPAIAHTTVITRLQPGQQEAGFRSISVSDAVARGLLNEKTGTFRDPNTGALMPVQTAIEQGLLRLSSEWPSGDRTQDITDGATMMSVDKWINEIKSNPEKSQELKTTGKATVESKLMRPTGDNNYSFTQTVVTKPKITEHVVSETKHFQVKTVLDPRSKREISVTEAVHRGILDLKGGHFIHPVTDERMTIEAALSRGFVRGVETSEPTQGTVKETKSFAIVGVIDPRTGQKVAVSQAVKDGIVDFEKGKYNGLDSKGRPMTLKISEAVEKGLVIVADDSSEKSSSANFMHETKTYQLKSVMNPITRERLEVADAIKQGLLDEHRGMYIHPRTGEKFTIPEAIERKFIDAELMSVMSNADSEGSKIITTKMTTLMVKFVIDPRTGETISVGRAVEAGILDNSMEKYTNPITGEVLLLNDAIDRKLVIAQPAALPRSRSSSNESIHIGADEEIMESNLVEEISSETVTFSINSVIDPRTMEMMSYDEAVNYRILDVSRGLYKNPMTGESMSINVALEKGLIQGEVTSKVKEDDKLQSSVDTSHLTFPLKKVTSVVDQRDGSDIALTKAIKDGIIDVENGTYWDRKRMQNIPLEDALERGYIKMSKTTDASDIEKFRLESERKSSERERRHLSSENGLDTQVDMKMERFNVSAEQDESVFADEVLNYNTAVEDKTDSGSLQIHRQDGARMWKQEQMAVIDTQPESPRSSSPIEDEYLPLNDGMSFQSAMKLGLIDARSGKIRDPETGKFISIAEAIDKELLDENKPAMKDVLTGRDITLRQCLQRGIIDKYSGKINEKKAKAEKVALRPDIEAKQTKGKPLNLLDCVATGLFDPNTGMITEPKTQRSYTLREALSQDVIDGNLVSVLDKQTGEKLPLISALRQGLIDGVTAEVVISEADDRLPLTQAIQEGIVENLFDKKTGTVYDTLTGHVVPLDKALTDGQIRSNEAHVLDTSTGEVVPLDIALRTGLVDVRTGSVTDKVTGTKMSPQEALKAGLLAVVGAPVLAGKAVYDAINSRAEQSQTTQAAVVNGNRQPPTSPGGVRQPVRINGTSTINGEMQLTHSENSKEQLHEPKTTIVYAKPGDRIKPSPPQQLYSEDSPSADEYHTTDRNSGVSAQFAFSVLCVFCSL